MLTAVLLLSVVRITLTALYSCMIYDHTACSKLRQRKRWWWCGRVIYRRLRQKQLARG